MSNTTNNNHDNDNSDFGALKSPVQALTSVDVSDYSQQLLQTYAVQSGEIDASAGAIHIRQGFRVGSVGLMIAYADGSELIDIPKLHHVPNSPAWFVGVTNLHGMVIPVFDLAIYIGLEHREKQKQRLLVLGQGNDAAAVIIDGLPDRLRWTTDQQVEKNTAPQKLQSHIRTACLLDDALWFDLDVVSLCQAFEDSLA